MSISNTEEYKSKVAYANEQAALYYNKGESDIPDSSYDSLIKEIEQFEKSTGSASKDSPTQRVGATVSVDDQLVKPHPSRLYSLDDVFDTDKLTEWVSKEAKAADIVLEPKLDGFTLNLIYTDGELTDVLSRGDGFEGESLLTNAKHVKGVPLKVNPNVHQNLWKGIVEVRGECIMPKATLLKLNTNNPNPFRNCRNAAAGSIRLKDPKDVAKRGLEFIAFDIVTPKFSISTIAKLTYLSESGFTSTYKWSKIIFKPKPEDIKKHLNGFLNDRGFLPFDIDGVVIKVSEVDLIKELGYTSRVPKWAKAFKFPAEEKTTTVKGIKFQVGRTGVITPVSILEPVKVGQAVITFTTLHNKSELDRKDVRKGDTVIVRRAGDVVPELVSVVKSKRPKNSKPTKFPSVCPDCNSELKQDEAMVAIRCTGGLKCPSQAKGKIAHFVSRAGMNIKGLGESLISKLYDEGFLKTPADVYYLKNGLESIGGKTATNLASAIEKSKTPKLSNFILALGIRYCNDGTSKRLARVYDSIEDIAKATYDDLMSIDDIGSTVATSIVTWFKNEQNQAMLKAILDAGVTPVNNSKPAPECNLILNIGDGVDVPTGTYHKTSSGRYCLNGGRDHTTGVISHFVSRAGMNTPSNKLKGEVYVITGSFEGYKRYDITEFLESNGARVSKTVSKNTDYLIAGAKAGSKLAKAKALGIDILGEEQVNDLFKRLN